MNYNDMPVIIPILATGYLLIVYILLILAQWTAKNARYLANSATASVITYGARDSTLQSNDIDSTDS